MEEHWRNTWRNRSLVSLQNLEFLMRNYFQSDKFRKFVTYHSCEWYKICLYPGIEITKLICKISEIGVEEGKVKVSTQAMGMLIADGGKGRKAWN